MAVLCTATDSHLYSTGTGFTNTANPFSISVWLNANWAAGSGALSMVGIYDGTPVGTGFPTNGGGLQIGTRAGTNDLVCWDYGGAILVQNATAMTGLSNVWVMITYTWDGTNHRVYLNGVQSATSTAAITPVNLTQVYINGYPPTGATNETSTIQVDSYLYYNRALSAPEILTIYNCGGARHGIFYGLVSRYEFDELSQGSSVSSVIDMSGLGNNMALSAAGITYTYTATYANSNLRPPL